MEMSENKNKKAYVIASLVAFVIDFILTGYVTMYIWNNVCVIYLGLPKITFWIGYLISFTITYFFRSNDLNRDNLNAKDTFEKCQQDIVYTLISWGFVVLLVNFLI